METQDCFQELMTIETTDWNNIPTPLIKAFSTMKKCIFNQLQVIAGNSDKVSSVGRLAETQLREFDVEIRNIKKSIAINDSLETIKKNISSLQTSLSSELGFLKKNNEGKASYLEQRIESIQKTIGQLPTVDDVEGKIRYNIRDLNLKLRKEIKDDIKINIIDIEIEKLSSGLKEFNEMIQDIEK